ncbi:hypothetical protein VMCG_10755 [Cytospora schulzeri]|uniref:Protein kinase domain-containing protein n=1 Tax=Cytospora schulzeri TaxID=448051 RepID=A0A423V8V8_9PEZI|nr:hypothetical protein VMCG_10755 [Valsa malicola]
MTLTTYENQSSIPKPATIPYPFAPVDIVHFVSSVPESRNAWPILSRQDEGLLDSTRWGMSAGDQHADRQGLLQNRGKWKSLGSGYEGDTFAYNGSVIKVFKPGRSPLRNCVPDVSPNIQWPPEIPVSLLLGGLRDQQHHASSASAQNDFLPVIDYFLLPTSRNNHPGEWHLVTPFLKSGTLEHLAKRLRLQDNPLTPDEVDARFRPSFNRLLRALDTMHMEHNLCHDDIKMDNIFVTRQSSTTEATANTSSILSNGDDAHWLLADLGNARQPSHTYHSSLLWAHDNDQHADCRVNDVVRLVKSYMFFLQSASSTRNDAFNEPFLTASAPWSQLYWFTINSARQPLDGTASAQRIFEVSNNVFPPSTTTGEELHSQYEVESIYDGAQSEDTHRLATPMMKAVWGERLWSGLGEPARKAFMISTDGTAYIVQEIDVHEVTQRPYARQHNIIFNHRSLIVENYKAAGFRDLSNLRYIGVHMTGDDEMDQNIENAVIALGVEPDFRRFTPVQLTKARNADW